MNLLIEYHKSKNLQRHSEFLTCLHENLGNSLIEKIYVFISDDSMLNFTHEKLNIYLSEDGRPTFKSFFRFANYYLKDQICIIANADIMFDESIKHLKDIKDTDFMALTRWEIDGDMDIANGNPACQDSWVFRTPVKLNDEMDFNAGGCWGCDNRIAYLMWKEGYTVRNPGLLIKTRHFHESNYRSVLPKTRLKGPYLAIEPSYSMIKKPRYTHLKEFNELGEAVFA